MVSEYTSHKMAYSRPRVVNVFSRYTSEFCACPWDQRKTKAHEPTTLLKGTEGPDPTAYFLLDAVTCAGPGATMPKCSKCDKEVYLLNDLTR